MTETESLLTSTVVLVFLSGGLVLASTKNSRLAKIAQLLFAITGLAYCAYGIYLLIISKPNIGIACIFISWAAGSLSMAMMNILEMHKMGQKRHSAIFFSNEKSIQ
jgi:hypothetical protein